VNLGNFPLTLRPGAEYREEIAKGSSRFISWFICRFSIGSGEAVEFTPATTWWREGPRLATRRRRGKHPSADQRDVSYISDPQDAASRLMEQEGNATEPPLEALVVTCSKLIPYHNLVLQALSNAVSSGNEQWDEIFSFTVRSSRGDPM